MESKEELTVGLAQIAPVWLERQATLEKVEAYVEEAAGKGCRLVVFGEAFVPGYPFWVELTDGARFESKFQKEMYALYSSQAVVMEDLASLRKLAARYGIAVYLGCIERAEDRSGHSLYCSLVYLNELGEIGSVHRKLMPTYEERLVWATGDGNGLRTHALGAFRVGGLNCWENWMPLPRAALYGQGEDLHVAVWPGGMHNTGDITRFIALEARSYVISVCGLLRREDVGEVHRWRENAPELISDGGSCVAAPDGTWVIAPCPNEEKLLVATLDARRVREARQNLDVSGHYSRPDVTQLAVDRRRQRIVTFREE